MGIYVSRGAANDAISDAELRALVRQTIASTGKTLRRILLLPPDHTRLNSRAGRITAIIVPGRCRWAGICGPRDEYIIPWHCIRRIGPDIVLVDIKPEDCRVPRGRQGWLFG